MTRFALAATLALLVGGCGDSDSASSGPTTPFGAFLTSYAAEVDPAWVRAKEAAWRTHTQVVPGDFATAQSAAGAQDSWRNIAADPRWIRGSRDLMREADANGAPPSAVEKAGVEAISRFARMYPATDTPLIQRIDKKEGLEARFRRRSQPHLDGEPVLVDEVVRRYGATTDTIERKALWKAMLAPPSDLKPTYAELRDLRNELARKGGWTNYMDVQAEPYGMTAAELTDFLSDVELAMRPLYQELHTWARQELGTRYNVAAPELIPAHWLPAPLGEDWSGLLLVEHEDIEPALQAMGAKQMVRQVEAWYTSTGLAPLPESFWANSSLFPVPPGTRMGKTQGAFTWDMDLQGDVRVLMSARPTASWYAATFREFGFAHAIQARHQAGLPSVLLQQPPRATLGALGLWADLAANRASRLKSAGLVEEAPDELATLLKEALTYVPFVQFGAGTVVPFEYEVYAENLSPGQMNSRWWGLTARHQGIFPPETRTERWADFLFVDALSDAPGRYADHVMSVLLAFQLQDAIASQAGTAPHQTDLFDNKAFGQMFTQLAVSEGVEDWRTAVQAATGSPPGADAMVRYFDPLYQWLKTQNAARKPTLPSLR